MTDSQDGPSFRRRTVDHPRGKTLGLKSRNPHQTGFYLRRCTCMPFPLSTYGFQTTSVVPQLGKYWEWLPTDRIEGLSTNQCSVDGVSQCWEDIFFVSDGWEPKEKCLIKLRYIKFIQHLTNHFVISRAWIIAISNVDSKGPSNLSRKKQHSNTLHFDNKPPTH